jgi:hypothetical protein
VRDRTQETQPASEELAVEVVSVDVLTLAVLVATSLFLVGMIWTIQVVHYPLFAEVGDGAFVAYEAAHTRRMGRLLAVPWGVQGVASAVLLLRVPDGVPVAAVWVAAVLVAVPVLVTIVSSVPAHRVLGDGFDRDAHARLVRTNWLRTAAWSAHGVLALWMLVAAGA